MTAASVGDRTPSSEPSAATSLADIVATPKEDEITAIQDSIDRLSLAMFEALRGLRDAVAPESGNAAAAAPTQGGGDTSDPDLEEFWQLYKSGHAETVALVLKANGGVPPRLQEDYVRIQAKMETEKDAELVARLATTVLQKSADVDERVASLRGMNRTRTEQMKLIEELLVWNQEVEMELEEAYNSAMQRRDHVRKALRDQTCRALGIDEHVD